MANRMHVIGEDLSKTLICVALPGICSDCFVRPKGVKIVTVKINCRESLLKLFVESFTRAAQSLQGLVGNATSLRRIVFAVVVIC